MCVITSHGTKATLYSPVRGHSPLTGPLFTLYIFTQQYDTTVFRNRFAELYHMCRKGQFQLLKDALHYDRDTLIYFTVRTLRGCTLLHEAVDADQPDVVQLLILHGVNPDALARGGLTPLHIATSKCQVGCVRALIENGADITVRDDLGQDAIAKAELRSKKCEAVLKLLRSKGKRRGHELIVHVHVRGGA